MIHHSRREAVVNREVEGIVPTGVPEAHGTNRHSSRFNVGMQLDVAKDSADRHTVSAATMHEVTEDGLTFWSRADISPGDILFIREFDASARGGWIRGRVRDLTRGLQGILVAVELDREQNDEAKSAVEPAPRFDPAPAPPPAIPPTMPTAGLRAPGPGRRRH